MNDGFRINTLFLSSATLAISLLLFSCSQKLNRINKHGQKTGRWITYSGGQKNIDCRYRNGNVVGTGYYYDMDGQLERKEVIKRKKIYTTFYHPGTKKVSRKGVAKIVITPEKVHYFYTGEWLHYDTLGELSMKCYFEMGNLVKTMRLKKGKFDDSLAARLLRVDEYFRKKNAKYLDSVTYSWSAPGLAEQYRNKIWMNDSLVFFEIERILAANGYPDKEICGELASSVPFYIFSHGNVRIRQKYLELFRAAQGTGQMSGVAFANYADKLRMAQGKKQLYGTQFMMKDRKEVYYPIEDPTNLNARRKELGLESMDVK